MTEGAVGNIINPNPIHENSLLQIKEKAEGPQAMLARQIGSKWSSVDLAGIEADQFFELELAKSVAFKDSVSLGERPELAGEHEFTKLAIVPRYLEKLHGTFFELVLVDKGNNTASLGKIYRERSVHEAKMLITYGGQKINIVVTDTDVSAKIAN
jgi:hypothetical protein